MKNPQQHWIKQIAEANKPSYLMIADLIAEDLRVGRLSPRDQLPTLRELAQMLGINYTTAARGYAEARKRGLIDTRTGSGTFALGSSPTLPLRGGSGAEMTMNLPPEIEDPALLSRISDSAAAALHDCDINLLLRYQDFGGTPTDRRVATKWLREFIPDAECEEILICPGIHSALAALMSLLARPGEMICVESLTYPGIKAIAAQLGVKLFGLPMDHGGVKVRAFEDACKTLSPKALYLNPTMLNPTTQTLDLQRREALADIALHYSIPIIEDDAYGMLPTKPVPALATLAPALTYYISGMSKCYGAGLRTAFVRSPTPRQAQRLAGALRATTVMASPVTTAIATRAINDGTAQAVLTAIRQECQSRQALADELLAGYAHSSHPEGFHLWLPVEESWNVVEFASYLRTQGVGVVASAAFSTDANPPNAVRICLGGPGGKFACETALRLIADTLTHPLHPHATML
ncbi:PLP-dependent aminotransferase family protein [Uliginosibacterium sediminicola]|uniref:PLP-dependent aminotransferase family protein n=1 Tax=Uliginosibacterium sediminicola TaxID=2024550 RepID=A0ABU9YVF2_9RHOO